MKRNRLLYLLPFALILLGIAACGGSSDTPTGTVQVSLTDAAAAEETFDNVLVTVTEVWFHKRDTAGPGEAGWLKYPLPVPKVVDLAHLTDGRIDNVLSQTLPVGDYRQIRVLLAPTEDNDYLAPYNNEVVQGPNSYPLRIPDAFHGIALQGTFHVAEASPLRLAIDFNLNNDVVRVTRNGATEFILKPRLRYFDLDNAGSITGTVSSAAGQHWFVIKAEQRDAGDNVYTVKRFTGVRADNTFVISFLKPGNYDIVLRGRGVETVIVRGVPVVRGANTPLLASGTIAMPAGTDFFGNTKVSPTGAWVNFYQTLDNAITGETNEYPYEIRYRHVNPFTGFFYNSIALSNGPIHFGNYAGGNSISFQAITPGEWNGGNAGFMAVADAINFTRTTCDNRTFDNTTAGPAFSSRLPVGPGSTGATASGTIFSRNRMRTAAVGMTLDNVMLFVTHGGMVVDSFFPTATQGAMTWSGNAGMMTNPAYATMPLPGGFPGAVYGIDGIGWTVSPPTFAAGIPGIADLRNGNDTTADFTMRKIF